MFWSCDRNALHPAVAWFRNHQILMLMNLAQVWQMEWQLCIFSSWGSFGWRYLTKEDLTLDLPRWSGLLEQVAQESQEWVQFSFQSPRFVSFRLVAQLWNSGNDPNFLLNTLCHISTPWCFESAGWVWTSAGHGGPWFRAKAAPLPWTWTTTSRLGWPLSSCVECAAQGDAAADCGPLDSGQFLTGGQQFGVKTDIPPLQMSSLTDVKTDIPPHLESSPYWKQGSCCHGLFQWVASKAAMSKQGCKVQSAYRLKQQKGHQKSNFFGEKKCFDNMQWPCDKEKTWKPAVQVTVTAFSNLFLFLNWVGRIF